MGVVIVVFAVVVVAAAAAGTITVVVHGHGRLAMWRKVHNALLGRQLGIRPAPGHQLVVLPGLNDRAVLEHDDVVGICHRRKLVRDDEHGLIPLPEDFVQDLLHLVLTLGIQRGRGFVQNQKRRRTDEDPRERHPLLLPAGQRIVAHPGCIPVRQLGHKLRRIGFPGRLCDVVAADPVGAVGDVLAHGQLEELWLLLHVANLLAVPLGIEALDGNAVREDTSRRRLVKALQQRDERGLPAARGADQRRHRAWLQRHCDPIQRLLALLQLALFVTGVNEVHVDEINPTGELVELQLALGGGRRHCRFTARGLWVRSRGRRRGFGIEKLHHPLT
mmetsp:Transcript_2302/g.5373  ORF Transcript_2302/g.5373 Transcript_2302/m.5373 type:complete len:332 (-) Transcript_2302:1451-2446(-)